MSPEDRAAFADARIAAVHAGLKLTPDQEKLWPPVEAAVRDFAKLRIDRANARMNAEKDGSSDAQKPDDPVARLRERADNMATTAAALKKIADAADPLYKTLDDGQKRRLKILTHFGHNGWRHHEGWRRARWRPRSRRRPGSWRRSGSWLRPRWRAGQGSWRPGLRAALAARGIRSIESSGKPPDSGGFFGIRAPRRWPGITPPACWTSGDRFAKRRPLAKAFPGRFRAHSSVGRADDS